MTKAKLRVGQKVFIAFGHAGYRPLPGEIRRIVEYTNGSYAYDIDAVFNEKEYWSTMIWQHSPRWVFLTKKEAEIFILEERSKSLGTQAASLLAEKRKIDQELNRLNGTAIPF